MKAGDNKVDAVVVDEESVGSVNSPGCGAKILRGPGALDKYLANVEHRVRFVFALWFQSSAKCFHMDISSYQNLLILNFLSEFLDCPSKNCISIAHSCDNRVEILSRHP